jgi:hypothetical protein
MRHAMNEVARVSNTELTPLGPAIDLGFIAAAFPVLTFTLHVIVRRGAELLGYAPNLGVCLALALLAVTVMVGLLAGWGQRWAVIGIALSYTGVAAWAAVGFRQLPDDGWDAQMYHLPSVVRLLSGWKPIVAATDLTLSNHYPSGTWTILAGFDAIFGFESGRAIGPILMLAASGAAWKTFRGAGIAAAPCAVVTVMLVANPIALSQFFTSYADGTLYELTLILICSLIIMLEDRGLAAALLAGAAMILVCNTKVVGLFFAALAVATWGGLLLFRYGPAWTTVRDRHRQIALLVAAGLLAVGFVGWRPYVVNVLEHHRVVYPPPDELGYKPGAEIGVPPNLAAAGRGPKLAALFFARTDRSQGPVSFKVPGTVDRHELLMGTETRGGGFGPFFGAVTLVALAALVWASVRRTTPRLVYRHRLEVLCGLTAYGLLTTVLFPEPWWARFVPFAWVIPLGAAWLAYALRPSPLVRGCVTLVVVLSVLDAAIAARCAVLDGVRGAADINQKLERMLQDPEPVYLSRGRLWNTTTAPRNDESLRSAAEDVWRWRLREHGKTAVVVLPRKDCRKIEYLTIDTERCASVGTPAPAEQN